MQRMIVAATAKGAKLLAIAARTREIATLRALGFGSSPIILSVLLESLGLALIGGGVGATAAYLAFDGFKAATINWQTFSQIAFAFSVTPRLLLNAIIWAATIGLLGGLPMTSTSQLRHGPQVPRIQAGPRLTPTRCSGRRRTFSRG